MISSFSPGDSKGAKRLIAHKFYQMVDRTQILGRNVTKWLVADIDDFVLLAGRLQRGQMVDRTQILPNG